MTPRSYSWWLFRRRCGFGVGVEVEFDFSVGSDVLPEQNSRESAFVFGCERVDSGWLGEDVFEHEGVHVGPVIPRLAQPGKVEPHQALDSA